VRRQARSERRRVRRRAVRSRHREGRRTGRSHPGSDAGTHGRRHLPRHPQRVGRRGWSRDRGNSQRRLTIVDPATEPIKAVRLRPPIRTALAVVILLLVVLFVWDAATREAYQWPLVGQYLLDRRISQAAI